MADVRYTLAELRDLVGADAFARLGLVGDRPWTFDLCFPPQGEPYAEVRIGEPPEPEPEPAQLALFAADPASVAGLDL